MNNKYLFFLLVCVLNPKLAFSFPTDNQRIVERNAMCWNDDMSASFYNGAFLGDGLQGAMVMLDDKNPNNIRMLLGHYQAIAHNSVPKWEYCDSRVYAGSIMIEPAGKVLHRTMKMDIWNGEIVGTIITDKGEVSWQLLSDRLRRVFVVKTKGTDGEKDTKATLREEWGITPRIYLEKKNPQDYSDYLPPLPEIRQNGDGFKMVVNRMSKRGAHVVTSLNESASACNQMYLAIGVDDNQNMTVAVEKAMSDAVQRVTNAFYDGFDNIQQKSRKWWHDYYNSASVELPNDTRWEQFWWIQMYKFACASAEESNFIMDTQGPWITESGWAGVWYNLNVQLSYMPMLTSQRALEEGKSLINGLDRLYNSGVLKSNAGGKGITIGRSSTYEGKSTWGSELGNMPWLLNCYWKYWKYSGDINLGKKLFSMLKDNAVYLMTEMQSNEEHFLEMKPSRSPEYDDSKLYVNANYALMSAKWVLSTLLAMNEELRMKSEEANLWKETLNKLSAYPVDINGLSISKEQGFEKGHRHYSHLIGIYPYHSLVPDSKENRRLICNSVNHWLDLTKKEGNSGYTYTGGCAMLATLGKGDEALSTLDLLYDRKLTRNTMYLEGGGQVIETPLSAVESINYMLVQSWGGVIRIFPALPSRWKKVKFKNILTEGAFAVSAEKNANKMNISIKSLKGNVCSVVNPYKQDLIIKDSKGKIIETEVIGEIYRFQTIVGMEYSLIKKN